MVRSKRPSAAPTPRIVIADDSKAQRSLLEGRLAAAGHPVVAAADGKEALDRLLADSELRLAVVDWEMPEMTGVEFCRQVRDKVRDRYVYVIVLTSRSSAEDVVQALDAGADDYLIKPWNALELAARVRVGHRIVALHDRLRHEAAHDALTGLLGRAAVLDRLRLASEMARSSGGSVASVMVDVDHFKRVNDTHGHPAGDRVLIEIAARLRRAARSIDAVGRLGGEEFVVVLPGSDAAQGVAYAERLREEVAASAIAIAGGEIHITASFGVASLDLMPGAAPEQMLEAADRALYRAKHAGRNRVEAAVARDWSEAGGQSHHAPARLSFVPVHSADGLRA